MTACRNPEHATAPADHCSGCAIACERELTALNDRYMRLLTGQADDHRRNAAASRRAAQDHMRAFAHLYLGESLRQYAPQLATAIGRAANLEPALLGRTADARRQLAILKADAAFAQQVIWKHVEPQAKDFAADPREAEITRLRNLIVAAGQRLHREVAEIPHCGTCGAYEHDPETTCTGTIPRRPPGWACTCAGCELIRDMDTTGLLADAEEATAS